MRHPPAPVPEEAFRGGPVPAALLLVCWGLLVGGLVAPDEAAAQTAETDGSLIERYQEARYRALARRHLQRQGALPVHPPVPIPTPTDSLYLVRSGPSARATAPAPTFPLHDVRPVRHLERGWFRTRFADTDWSFLGDTSDLTFLDTTRTPTLRARLQARFGDPTRTFADASLDEPPTDQAQFEYWFVVNDSIPVQVMDALGPKGRGLIVAADRAHRDRLRALRDTLLAPLRRVKNAPHVDYYYDTRRERWYRTGFDGQSFFLERISRNEIIPGRPPRLDTVRTSDSEPPSRPSSP